MDSTYVRSGHLHSSGYIRKSRTVVKAMDVVGSASAGTLEVWDTLTVPITTGTYGRSGTTVTVTDTGHGLSTGDNIGISFEPDGGVIATPGNYEITVVDADTFTLVDINTGTIANDPDCRYVYGVDGAGLESRWMVTYHTAAGDTFYNGFNVPDNGIMARKAVYVYVENLVSINVYYG